jgi:transposase
MSSHQCGIFISQMVSSGEGALPASVDIGKAGLRDRQVPIVVEQPGVYTEPVYYALAGLGFTEVMVINPAHAKALKGHKTDAKDAIRLLDLYECGLLSGSYIPAPDLREVRDLVRYRMKTVQARASEIQRPQKTLETAVGSSCPRWCPTLPGYRRRR